MGSTFFPRSRLSVGLWAVNEMLSLQSGVRWRRRDDLMADVAELGDTVYVKPTVHLLEHNAVSLLRVKNFLGLNSSKVTVLHYDSEMPVGQFASAFGGRTKNNEALKMVAGALKEEGFGRVGLGVAEGQVEEDRFAGLFTLGFRGVPLQHMDRWWLANRMHADQHERIRKDILEQVAVELTGNARAGSVLDKRTRL